MEGTTKEIIEKCAALNTSVYSFDSVDEIGLMTEVMKNKGIKSLAFVPFMSMSELLGRESQQYLWLRPSTFTSSAFGSTLLAMYNIDGTIGLLTEANSSVKSFCSKPANPFDSLDFDQYESRTWLRLVGRSITSLKTFERLYNDVRDNMKNFRTGTGKASDKVELERVTWVVPSEMLRAVEFVTGHDTALTWEVATGQTLQELSQFALDMGVITEYLSERLVFTSDRIILYPKFEREGLNGLVIKEMIFYTRPITEESDTEPLKLILRGEAIGNSITDLTKAYLYRGYAHGFDSLKPMDSIVVSTPGSYRAVPQFEDLKWECTHVKSKKICSETDKAVTEAELLCGDYFFGRTENYHKCPLMEVEGPIVFSSVCGIDSEVLSSYYQSYKLSLWCNGYLSETLELPPGVSTTSTRCEVRSVDGRNIYTHQTGLIVEKGATSTMLSSSTKNIILRTFEDILGWPATGTIFGSVALFLIGLCTWILKCMGYIKPKNKYSSPSNIRGGDPERVMRLARNVAARSMSPPPSATYEIVPRSSGRRLALL